MKSSQCMLKIFVNKIELFEKYKISSHLLQEMTVTLRKKQ